MTSRYISDVAREASDSLIRAKEAYDYGKDCSDLPGIFHKVAQALSVTQQSLQSVYQYHGKQDPRAEQEDYDATKTAVSEARARSQCVANILREVVHARDGARQTEYQKLVGGDKPVEVLMKDLIEATLVVAKPPAVTDEQHEALDESLSAISKLQPAPMENKGAGINYYGSGTQAIHQGDGNQNINAGDGIQMNGNFGPLPPDAFKARRRDNGRGQR